MSTKPQHRPSSKDSVVQWITEYQQGESDVAQTKLVEHYKPLVLTLSRKFARGPEHAEDLFQVGMLGLLGAIRRFDPTVGKSFESFAVPTVIGEIKRYIRDKTWSVHVPRRIKELGPKIKKAVDQLTNDLQRSPKVNEIAELINVSEEEVLEAMEMGRSYQALSVDRPIEADQEGGEATLLDLVGRQEEGYEQTDQQILLEKAFQVLSERERQILQLTYYENLSQKETGDQLGISQMHVSRLQRRALQKLRETINIKPTECLK
ncbi:RNA polymerase sigma factor SigB [Alkalihalobacterium elongatum]|uniref:RNA polymerase sigma factor SigB n=1 Tax=Alkalihalobacterium elongatum TaxID=2675466 RepID=UPI001C1F3752|nr:RNA polymerase sigma factor SigB [Alkalihalobacterium elongatum]